MAILPTSCRKDAPKSVDPIAHNAYYDIWPDSIDLHDGVVLRAMSDSLMEVRVSGNVLDSITAGAIRVVQTLDDDSARQDDFQVNPSVA